MEPNTSKPSLNPSCDDDLDVSKINEDLADLDIKKAEPVKNPVIVFFSLDTTYINTKISEILQIAYACRDNNGEIIRENVYMMPERYGIAPSTSVNKGYTIEYTDNRKQLKLNNEEVVAETQKEGLNKFLDFLSDQSASGTRIVLLAAHALNNVGRHVLFRQIATNGLLPRCQELVAGFIDTYYVAKTELRGRFTGFNLKNLATTFLGENSLQPPLADVTVEVLMTLISHPDINFTEDILLSYRYAFDFVLYSLKFDFGSLIELATLKVIANAGISSSRLQTEYEKKNGDVSNLLERFVDQDVIQIMKVRLFEMSNAN